MVNDLSSIALTMACLSQVLVEGYQPVQVVAGQDVLTSRGIVNNLLSFAIGCRSIGGSG